ncbi:Glycosyl transferase, family 2 [[Actinomadura] parvosata subsp. kistnae]|uniref:glycosyltransferase family 2 protein n=1 Tax=[Actinomadura] parvosata TaxID=1955412 RepID=UPI000D296483|nr:glycosyltransferase family 2 protein [Nonomuraea sp. ATCC 55076]SPL95310.1 Glycosyl transferase, family 2 [Actinomadura parvosata subsp. kistnae]
MSRPYVTAIVVAHDGARWLGETLRALIHQSRRPDRVAGVDNGSRDGSAELLGQTLGPGNLISLPRSHSFGESVAKALDRMPPSGAGEWIWLLHDDCAPDRRALEMLLDAAEQDPKAAVLGPKLLDWIDRRRLLEIGVTVGRTGRRDTGLEPREFDQGQHDGTRDVLSVSTAGMLIRRDVWEQVGGLDPFLPLFRDDLDLCWRVRNAGHKVLNVTSAVAWHAEAAARRRRRITVSGDHPRRLDRRNAIFVVMANLPFGAMVWALLRNVLGSFFRTLLFIVSKQPANALDEVVAMASVLAHPFRLLRARRARSYGRKKGYIRIKRLMTPRGAAYRRLTDMVQSFLAGEAPVDAAGQHHHHVAHASHADDQDAAPPTDTGAFQRFIGRPGVILMLALTAVSMVAERSLLGGERLGGGALVPVTGGAADLWAFYLEGFHDVGLGSTAPTPPYVAVLAALSTLALGKTWLAVSVLLLGSVPLAGATAYLATRHLIPSVPARAWAAGTYALLPVATGAISGGRLGTAVVFALLPVYAWLLGIVLLTPDRRRARRAAWALGLWLAVGMAFVPLVYPLVAGVGVLGAVGLGRLLANGRDPDTHNDPDTHDHLADTATPAPAFTPGPATAFAPGTATAFTAATAPGIAAAPGTATASATAFTPSAAFTPGAAMGPATAAAPGAAFLAGTAFAPSAAFDPDAAPTTAQGAATAFTAGAAPATAFEAAGGVSAGTGRHGRAGDRPERAAGRRGRTGEGRERAGGRRGRTGAGDGHERAGGRRGRGRADHPGVRASNREALVSILIALAVPPVLLLPWTATLVTDPGRFLLEAGLHDPSLVNPSLPPESLLALSPGGPGLPPFWVTAGLVAAALAALLMRRQRVIVAIGWGVALYGMLAAVLVSRVTVEGAKVWPGVPLAFAGTGLVVLVGLTAHRLAELRAGGGLRRLGATVMVAVAFSTPLLAAGYWVVSGVRGPLVGDARDVMPALAAARTTQGERTLVIKGSGFTVLHGRTPLIGEAELPVASEARERVTAAVQGLVGGRGGDAATLAAQGIAMVAVAPPVSPELAKTLDSQPSLERMSLSDTGGGLWRLAEQVTRVPAQPVSVLHAVWLWAQGALLLVVALLASPGRRQPPEPAESPAVAPAGA